MAKLLFKANCELCDTVFFVYEGNETYHEYDWELEKILRCSICISYQKDKDKIKFKNDSVKHIIDKTRDFLYLLCDEYFK